MTDHRKNDQKGRWAESLCCFSLRLRGYRILAQRFRTPRGEIDIIARRGSVLAIIEVKARPTICQASEAISRTQQRRLTQAAALYLAQNQSYQGLFCRFDAMLVVPRRWPRHLLNAWQAND